MPNRILIANRGEIALRILRACQKLGKKTVAIYTAVDANLPHLDLADDTVCVSHYLDANDIVMAGLTRRCDAVHPGYGLLSENAAFAEQVESSGMVFIGPSPQHISALGDKTAARKIFSGLDIPCIPGSVEAVSSVEEAFEVAAVLGYPLIIKAAFGGGGRGIRKVDSAAGLAEAFDVSVSEAEVGFGRSEVFVEKLIENARHIEVQVLGDGKGGCVHLGTRDCSVQRRYQKLVEECPAPNIDNVCLDALTEKCVEAMAKLGYRNVATLEFLHTPGEFFFLEVNTRLQVEHPVTEMVSGIDLVAAQFQIADSGVIPFTQESIHLVGHSIECRILAEDAAGLAGPGEIMGLRLPGGPGIRFDSHLYVGYRVPHQYDSLVGKLVVHAEDREMALARLKQALNELRIDGIPTNIERLKRLTSDSTFMNVKFHTNWNPQ
tara:strand:- start:5556 stop:6860 length:1305 start_codon:yes stop_codon:yes gene_type:complete